ncbi:MAG: DUF465 domain-containing protein [Gemmobacter sp.]|nr:DUF465 domain-containing protein [Gemmobacter sp.]
MSNTPHELAEEFPQAVDKIHTMKLENAHFARLCDEYHEVNRAIHRAETRAEVVSEEHETSLRRTRMTLKDEISKMLSA